MAEKLRERTRKVLRNLRRNRGSCSRIFCMDNLDREILSALQEDGRISVTELASRVGLSLSACHRRVRELEQSGVIEQYRAVVSPTAVGLTFEAIVFVTISRTDPDTVGAFEEAVVAIPNVTEAERLFGDPDYMLRILTPSLAAYQELYDGPLGGLPGIQRMTSTLVMKRLGAGAGVPLG
ncbi:MAG: Lrp/AsnC family transcriptional regulator [Actinobacteria bacterium]|nr:Lrp/AsnC family transcriptional regulator [Actinomycetota bacterium]